MKHFELKLAPNPKFEPDPTLTDEQNDAAAHAQSLDYKQVCMTILGQPPAEGSTMAELRQRLRVMDKLDSYKEREVAHLEDADHAYLLAAVQNYHHWTLVDSRLPEFEDALASAAGDDSD